jgi:tetratricopeptide (TPR) repeat protein
MLGNEFDEVVLRCSPWRTYEAAAEAMLRVGHGMDVARTSGEYREVDGDYSNNKSERSDISRARFVGGRMAESPLMDFQEEKAVNHREKALELISRAISLFERELEKEKRGFYAEDEFSERSSSRTGSRLYYLAGGILLGMERHQEAVDHLTKASRYSRGWRELELAVRRLLIECYEKHIPSETEASVSSETLVSMILDSYFNAEMSSQDLRRALDHFSSISGGDRLKWYHEMQDEEDPAVPFSFAVTFPGQTHATSGDTVEASVVIKSNLDYAIHVNAASLGTLAGQLPIPTNDLLSATNASEGTEGGIIIQAKTAITVSTKLELPKDLSAIASDDSGNGGELLGVAGKGSFAKNAKPRSAGLTSAGEINFFVGSAFFIWPN